MKSLLSTLVILMLLAHLVTGKCKILGREKRMLVSLKQDPVHESLVSSELRGRVLTGREMRFVPKFLKVLRLEHYL